MTASYEQFVDHYFTTDGHGHLHVRASGIADLVGIPFSEVVPHLIG